MRYQPINFTYEEFESPDRPGSGANINDELLRKLDVARNFYCKPIHINSGFRTKKHNIEVGGVSNSAHTKGFASDLRADNTATLLAFKDIKAESSRERWSAISCNIVPLSPLLQALVDAGFNRIGLGNTFIHVDIDQSKADNVCWTYS